MAETSSGLTFVGDEVTNQAAKNRLFIALSISASLNEITLQETNKTAYELATSTYLGPSAGTTVLSVIKYAQLTDQNDWERQWGFPITNHWSRNWTMGDGNMHMLNTDGVECNVVEGRLSLSMTTGRMAMSDIRHECAPNFKPARLINAFVWQYELVQEGTAPPRLTSDRPHYQFGHRDRQKKFTPLLTVLDPSHPTRALRLA